jgi:hypothetical protein
MLKKTLNLKTSRLEASYRGQIAATAIPARSLFWMICCKARHILTESATAVRNTFMCQSYPKQAPNGLLSPALPPMGRRRRRQKECTDLCV